MRTTGLLPSWMLLMTCLVLGGCSVFDRDSKQQAEAARLRATRQWHALRELVEAFTATIEEGGRQIAQESDDLRIKRMSVIYRMRATETVRQLLWFEQPAEAMVDL